MQARIRLGHVWGIPIGLHTSWFIVFLLVTFSLAVGYFPEEYEDLSPVVYWLLGVVTSALFFASVLLHELSHAWVALRNQIPVRGITLFIFGGVAQIERDPVTPGVEFRMAAAGPLASLGLAAAFFGVYEVAQPAAVLAAPSIYLARINLALGLFNLLPGFPLDGGRVLRAIVWRITGSFRRATQIAGGIGQLVAFGFMALGVLLLLSGALFNGLWLIFIGWFLQNAAASVVAQSHLRETLQGVTVGQVMSRECRLIPRDQPIRAVVENLILQQGQRCFLVGSGEHMEGMLTLRDLKNVPREQWDQTTAAQLMVPWERLVRVHPDTDLFDALREMETADVAQVPVIDQGQLVGMLSREQIVRYIRLRSQLDT